MNIYKKIELYETHHPMLTRTSNHIPPLRWFLAWAGQKAADCHVVSYAKCGETWVQEILIKYFGCNLIDAHIRYGVPYIKFSHRRKVDNKKAGVILLTRQAGDVMISYYHHMTKRHCTFRGSVLDFLKSEKYGIKSYRKFHEYWEKKAGHTVSYEQLRENTYHHMKRLFSHLGIECDGTRLQKAIVKCSFENMYKGQFKRQDGSMRVPDKSDPNSYKVRRGKVGGYKDEMTSMEIELCQI